MVISAKIQARIGYLSRRLFENIVTKEEIAQNEQFLLLSSCFQLYSIIVLPFKGSFSNFFGYVFSKSSAAVFRFPVCRKGLRDMLTLSLI